MKHVLIVISSFRWGGINKSLQSWLNYIDPAEMDVDIFVTVHSGNYERCFNHCTILPEDRNLGSLLDQKEYRKGMKLFRFAVLKALNKLTKGKFQRWLYGKVGNRLVSRKEYDAVIGWGEGVPTAFVSRIEHPNKIAWIHCDYTQYTSGPTERDIYARFNSIVCVSKFTRKTFLSYYPEFEDKVHAIYNILDVDEIRRLAKEPMDIEYDKSVFNIVSVGRVAPVKRFSAIPSIAKKLVDAGCEFRWYIVGPYCIDDEYNKIVNDTKEFGLEDKVILLGGRTNPYPYIANADLLVTTSISEAAPYVVLEALILGKPVVAADFGSAREFVTDGETGFVAQLDRVNERIFEIFQNSMIHKMLEKRLNNYIYNNDIVSSDIEKLLYERVRSSQNCQKHI